MKERIGANNVQADVNESGDWPAPSRDAFATLVMEQCLARDQSRNLVHDHDRFEIVDKTSGARMCLRHVYAAYCSAEGGRRQDLLGPYITFFSSMIPYLPSSFVEAEARIFPVICSAWEREAARLAESSCGGANGLFRRLTDNLAIAVAWDMPTVAIYLQKDILKEWNVSEDVLFATAIANTRKLLMGRVLKGTLTPATEFAAQHDVTTTQLLAVGRAAAQGSQQKMKPEDLGSSRFGALSLEDFGFAQTEGHPGLFTSAEDDWLCPSRILIDEWIRALPVKGEPVAMITHRGLLLVTGTEDTNGLVEMARLADAAQGLGHSVSNIPIHLTSSGWEVYQLPRNHPAFAAFERLRSVELMTS